MPSYVFGHITNGNIDNQLYKFRETQQQECNLISDEDMSFMTYSELHFFFLFIIAINHVKNTHDMRCISVAVEGDSFF